MNNNELANSRGSDMHSGKLIDRKCTVLLLVLAFSQFAIAEQSCFRGIQIEGVITDPTGAVIPGAQIEADGGVTAMTDEAGHYVLRCVPTTSATVTVHAEGFARGTGHAHGRSGGTAHVNLRLAVASVETDVEVNANTSGIDSSDTASSAVLGTADVERLSDDPDDLLRELQTLAASGGGAPENTVVAVNGFQRASSLPSKNSIASIQINPDPFSSEHETAPWMGGRIEVNTKPGAKAYHGALFFVESDHAFNATDPFSLTATPAGKQRYGLELSGPIRGKNTDFFLALERRDISEFNVVNAVTLDGENNPAPSQQAVTAPQRLWVGSARADWQITPTDAATLSFSANINNLDNQGIGGLVLPESGFNALASEYDLRLFNTQILSPRLLHETRIGYTWNGTEQIPLSTQPSLLVAGFFIGGGSTSGNLNSRERDLEADDDFIVTHGNHSLKFGVQSLGSFLHDSDPDTFNGAYIFGGGSAPVLDASNNPTGETTTINAIEQYRRALLNLSGGTPTTFQINSGTPLVPLTQWRLALYAQDSAKLASRLTVNGGLRYQLQTAPGSYANFAPRVGLAWAPDKKSTWVIHVNAGLFCAPVGPAYALQVNRLNGFRQQETTIYSPSFQNPLTPAAGSISVNTLWQQLPKQFAQWPSLMTQAGIEHDFRHRWQAEVDFDYGANWDQVREENINAPLVASSVGIAPDPIEALLAPRPVAPNENIFRYEELAHLRGRVLVVALRQNSYKRFGLSANYLHMNMQSDGGFRTGNATGAANPQSSYSEQGESSRVDWETRNIFFFMGNAKLPFKLDFSTLLNASSGRPYNITTGTDANGDGDFNDRPSYASNPGPGVYATPFGLLTTNTVNGTVPRNLGTMPGLVHLDANLSRVFTLNPNDRDHPRNFTLNARSTNLLNHTNVTLVNTILSSGAVGQPLAAETARRLELGIRFAF